MSKRLYADEPELAAVQPNSPAYQAGLKPKDKIVEIDGHKIARQAELKHLLGPHYAGDKVKLVVLRGSDRLRVELFAKSVIGFMPNGLGTMGRYHARP